VRQHYALRWALRHAPCLADFESVPESTATRSNFSSYLSLIPTSDIIFYQCSIEKHFSVENSHQAIFLPLLLALRLEVIPQHLFFEWMEEEDVARESRHKEEIARAVQALDEKGILQLRWTQQK
jgi:hypothetical protein